MKDEGKRDGAKERNGEGGKETAEKSEDGNRAFSRAFINYVV